MPKNKKKSKTGKSGNKNQSGDDGDNNSEFNHNENESTISNASTNMSYQHDIDMDDDKKGGDGSSGGDFTERINDNIDAQINTSLDGLIEKGFKEREESLKIFRKLFSSKYLIDNLIDRRFTLTESLIRSLKRGKTSEQLLAADVMTLTFIQFGYYSTDTVAFLNDSRQTLLEFIEDEKIDAEVRALCIRTLGFAYFITNEASADIMPILEKLENIFSQSYAKGDGTLRTFTSKQYDLQSTALSIWSLLLTILPLQVVNKLSQKHVAHFQDFLRSADVDLRITAGETIALLFELAQCDSHADISYFKDETLLETIKTLAKDSAKYRSKKDKKVQRSSFRDILKTLNENDFENIQIKFQSEILYIDNWIRRHHYEQFRDILSQGVNTHLAENECLREIFDLGPPLPSNDTSAKSNLNSATRMQKTQFQKEQFRNRTKALHKKRENKGMAQTSATTGEFDD